VIKFTRKELWIDQAQRWNLPLDEEEMLEIALEMGFVTPIQGEEDLYLVNEELKRKEVLKKSIRRVRFGPTSQFEVLLDAPEDTESLSLLQVHLLTLDSVRELLSVPVEVGKDNKVRGVSEGTYLHVEVEGPSTVDESLLPDNFIGLMQIDSSGYDSHRYSVECVVDGESHIKKLPTAMLVEVFDTVEELVEFAKARMLSKLLSQ